MRLPPRKIKPAAWPTLLLGLSLLRVSAAAAQETALRIGCSIPPVAELVREVVGDAAGVEVVSMAVTGGGCAHEISLTPGDIRRARSCDILVVLGLGADELPTGDAIGGGKGAARTIRLAEVLDARSLIRETEGEDSHAGHDHDQHEHDHGGHDHGDGGAVNTHVWTSPRIMATLADRLASMLAEADPDRADAYRANAGALAARLRDVGMILATEPAAAIRLVTMHSALDYFARDVGVPVAAHILDLDENEPAPREFARLVELCRADPGIVIVAEPHYSERVPLALARESGRPMIRLESGGSQPSAGGIAGRFERDRTAIVSRLAGRGGGDQ